jgi:hypothetical protein
MDEVSLVGIGAKNVHNDESEAMVLGFVTKCILATSGAFLKLSLYN